MPGWLRFESASIPAGEPHPALAEPPAVGWLESTAPAREWSASGIDVLEQELGRDVVRVVATAAGRQTVRAVVDREPGERFFGFGIRSDAASRTAGDVENWVGEGPYQLDEYPLIEAITPRWAVRRRRDAAYFIVPWAISATGRALLIESPEYSRFDFNDERRWFAEVRAPRLSVLAVSTGSMADALERLTWATGRQPVPRAPWFLGPWVQTGHENLVPVDLEAQILDDLASAPPAAVETHMRRLPGGAHEGLRDAERGRTALFNRRGLPSVTYLNPFVSQDYEARFAEAGPLLQQRADGGPYLFDAYIGDRDPPVTSEGQLDFSHPGAEDFFAALAREAVEDGHRGWMEDFGEYTPVDARLHDGRTGAEAHNPYPTEFHAAAARAARKVDGGLPLARFGRSGWTGTAAHLPLVWGGDPTTGWGFDGLASAVIQGINAGLSGIALWGSDIGGFFTLSDQELDAELLTRWLQFGALSPFMRTKAAGIAIPPRRRPQVWDPEVLPHWRRWSSVHVRLRPYLLRAAEEYAQTGMPIIRHLALVAGTEFAGVEDEYLLGPDLLVAPVLAPGVDRRLVAVPPGAWIDPWSGRRIEGPDEVELPAPIDRVPVLARPGAEALLADGWAATFP